MPTGIGLTSLPAWLRTHTDISPASLVYIANGVVVVLDDKRAVAGGPGRRMDVMIRREALSYNATQVIRGHSDLIRLELDCTTAQYWMLGAHVYPGNDLTGPVKVLGPGVGSGTVAPNTDMAYIMRAACDPNHKPPLSPHMANSKVPHGAHAATATPGPPLAGGAATFAAQVAAAESEAGARITLADLAKRFPEVANRPMQVESVHAGGKVLFRGSFGGFSARRQAEVFCVRLRAAGHGCWVR